MELLLGGGGGFIALILVLLLAEARKRRARNHGEDSCRGCSCAARREGLQRSGLFGLRGARAGSHLAVRAKSREITTAQSKVFASPILVHQSFACRHSRCGPFQGF